MTTSTYVLRTPKADLFSRYKQLKEVLPHVARLNIVLTDVETMKEADFTAYRTVLEALGDELEALYAAGQSPQLNLLTDRMMLDGMNNCDAGWHSLTLAPDGRFYVCPAFCAGGEAESVGTLAVRGHGQFLPGREIKEIKYLDPFEVREEW